MDRVPVMLLMHLSIFTDTDVRPQLTIGYALVFRPK